MRPWRRSTPGRRRPRRLRSFGGSSRRTSPARCRRAGAETGDTTAAAPPRLEDYAAGAGEEVIRVHLPSGPVDYLVCLHAPNDWRVKDVTGVKTGSLRKALKLRPAEAVEGC